MGFVLRAPRVFLDLREAGETCSKHRVVRLMRVNKIRAVRGYRIRHSSASKPSELISNVLKRNFDVASPNKAWVTATSIAFAESDQQRVRLEC